MKKSGVFKLFGGAVLAATSLVLLLPAAAVAGEPGQDSAARDQEMKEAYLKAVPHPGGMEQESDLIKMHSLRNWYLMTYPTGKMPSTPWDKALLHNRIHVQDAPVWKGPGLRRPGQDGKAVIAPGTNSWVLYGPKPLDSVGTTNNAYQYGIVSGRVNTGGLAVDPVNPAVAYAGFAAGGFWKTTNLGSATVTWTPLWDDKDFVVQSAVALWFTTLSAIAATIVSIACLIF